MKKGVSEYKEFPYPQAEDYIGMRGSFEATKNGWLLTQYLGGD